MTNRTHNQTTKQAPSVRTGSVKRRTSNPSRQRNNPFSSCSSCVSKYRNYVARRSNSKSTRTSSSGQKSTVGNSVLSNIKNLETKKSLGLIAEKDKYTYFGPIAALGKAVNSLNYNQGTSKGDGTCGLCSLANIAHTIKMMRGLVKGGTKGLNDILAQMKKKKTNKKAEYIMITKGKHEGGGGTTHGDQVKNMKNMPKLIGKFLGLKNLKIYGGALMGKVSDLKKVFQQGRLAQINISSSGLGSGGNMVNGGIDHAVALTGMRVGKDGKTEFAINNSSGGTNKTTWVKESQLKGRKFEITYTKPLTELINA